MVSQTSSTLPRTLRQGKRSYIATMEFDLYRPVTVQTPGWCLGRSRCPALNLFPEHNVTILVRACRVFFEVGCYRIAESNLAFLSEGERDEF